MKQSKKSKTKYVPVAVGIIVVLLVAQTVFDIGLYRSRPKKDSNTLAQLIIMSVHALYKPAAVDAKTGTIYLPEVHLSLPPVTDAIHQLLYSYNFGNTSDATLTITSTNLLSQAESKLLIAWGEHPDSDSAGLKAMFATVPNYQACARAIELYTQPAVTKNSSLVAVATLHLNDKRSLYAYRDSLCHEDISALTAEVKQAQSY